MRRRHPRDGGQVVSKRRNRRMRINPWLVKLIDGNLVLTETRGDVSIVVTVVLGDETWTAG